MNYADDPKFKSIVGLTQYRDLRALRTGLVATIIGEIGTGLPTRLYERNTKQSAWSVVEFYDIAAQEKLIPHRSHNEIDDLFTASQRKADLATLHLVKGFHIHSFNETIDDRPRTLFPIYSGKQLISCLIIEGNLQQDEKIYIDTILQVYTNLFLLLKNSIQDSLTGLLNRQAFDRNIQKIDNASGKKRRGSEGPDENSCFAFFDIDHFKRVNDDFGHLYGDEVLVLFSNLMKEFFRESDEKYRYGGEEFVAILKGVSLELACSILERFRKKVASYLFPQVGQITVSIGVTNIERNTPMITIIERADKAVYHSKEHGRNQISTWEDINNESHSDIANGSDISLF